MGQQERRLTVPWFVIEDPEAWAAEGERWPRGREARSSDSDGAEISAGGSEIA